jgi:hypothetical protein
LQWRLFGQSFVYNPLGRHQWRQCCRCCTSMAASALEDSE